jgi:hypothetical protein
MSGYKTLLPSEKAYIDECRRGLKDLGFTVVGKDFFVRLINRLDAAEKRVKELEQFKRSF